MDNDLASKIVADWADHPTTRKSEELFQWDLEERSAKELHEFLCQVPDISQWGVAPGDHAATVFLLNPIALLEVTLRVDPDRHRLLLRVTSNPVDPANSQAQLEQTMSYPARHYLERHWRFRLGEQEIYFKTEEAVVEGRDPPSLELLARALASRLGLLAAESSPSA